MLLLLLLGVALYLVKVLEYPLYFTFFDEFLHWRTAQDILGSGHLFTPNSLLPVSPFFPGEEIVTDALCKLTGLSVYPAGIFLMGVARLLCMLALYLFFERVSASSRVAGVAALIFVANPHFLFFDAQFAYESLALPLAVTVLFFLVRSLHSAGNERLVLALVACVVLAAVIVTHHVTSYLLVAFLLLWSLCILLVKGKEKGSYLIFSTTIFGLILAATWLATVGILVISYLPPVLGDAIHQAVQLILRQSTIRPLFTDATGGVEPTWERLAATGSVAMTVLILPFALFWIWRQKRTDPLALALGLVALLYPASLALRITPSGAEPAIRLSPFLFIGLGYVIAEWLIAPHFSWFSDRIRRVVFSLGATLLYVGGIVSGSGPLWARLPGPYLVSADMRSIDPEGIAAAQWAAAHLPPGSHIASDRINRLLMSTYGRLYAVTSIGNNVEVSPLFYSLTFDSFDAALLREGRIRFLIADRRLSTSLPYVGVYFEAGETGLQPILTPLDPEGLEKYNQLPGVDHIYDSGNIEMYDVEELAHG